MKKRLLDTDDKLELEYCAKCKVSFAEDQGLSDTQKEVARNNIGAQPAGNYITDEVWGEVQENKGAAEAAAAAAKASEEAAAVSSESANESVGMASAAAGMAIQHAKEAAEAEARTAALAARAEESVADGAYVSFWMDEDGALWMDKTQNAEELNFYADDDGAVYMEVNA